MRALRMTMVFVVTVALAATWGCASVGGPGPDTKVEVGTGPLPAESVLEALDGFHSALKTGDVEGAMAAVSDNYRNSQGADKSSIRTLIEGLVSQGALAATAINMGACEVVVDGNKARAKPVVYESPGESSAQEYGLQKEPDGAWRIVSSEQITSPSVDIWTAAATGNIPVLEQHVGVGTDMDALDPNGGNTPLNIAALVGQTTAAGFLVENGADVDARNRGGNAALHTAAFLGHIDTVKLLLDGGADRTARGSSGQTPLESVTGPWTEELEGIYQYVAGIYQMQLDLERIKAARPKIAALLSREADDTSAKPASAEGLSTIQLPAPKMSGGRPLMDVLKDRKTTRNFSRTKLPDQVLSDLLWAAWGLNRPEKGLHTAPSSSNQQEIDVYVALEKGLYVYDPRVHALKPVLAEDLRGATGTQRFVKNVPLNLVYVADHGRMYPGSGMDKNMKESISAANTGFIAQNVYLFCASEGLGTVVRGLVDREALAKRMKLRPDQAVVYAQSIGYPKGSM